MWRLCNTAVGGACLSNLSSPSLSPHLLYYPSPQCCSPLSPVSFIFYVICTPFSVPSCCLPLPHFPPTFSSARYRKLLIQYLNEIEPPIIIFVNQKKGADVLARSLEKMGVSVMAGMGGGEGGERIVGAG